MKPTYLEPRKEHYYRREDGKMSHVRLLQNKVQLLFVFLTNFIINFNLERR